jgi:LemA protein
MTVVFVAVGLGVALLLWSVFAFNALVKAHNRVNESWSGVDVQLKRRHDLVPNLLRTVEAYAAHERAVVNAVADAWETASTSSGRRGRQAAEYELSEAIADARALAERYPDLRASEEFHRLQAQLAEVESEIQYARRIYNSNVQRFNARVHGFPASIVRRLGGFRAIGYFELTTVWRSAPGSKTTANESRTAAA